MTYSYSIKGIQISILDMKNVRQAKWDYINHLNWSGTYYSAIRCLSGMFNEIFSIFNTEKEETFDISNREIGEYDAKKMREYSEKFFEDMKKTNVSQEIYDYFHKFVVEYVNLLEQVSLDIRAKRAEIAKAKEELESQV